MSGGAGTDRRSFLKLMGLAGGGLVLSVPLSGCSSADDAPYPDSREDAWQADAFLQVTEAGQVRLLLPQAEMGQGVTMGLATLVAEELNMPPSAIAVTVAGVHPDYDLTGGMQITGGSASIRERYQPLRESAARARTLLLQAAARQWRQPLTELTLLNGRICAGSRCESLAAFVAVAASLPEPETVTLTPDSELQWIGYDREPRVDALAKVTGRAQFGLDVQLPGMRRAALKRCPVTGGRVKSWRSQGVEQQSGVQQVVDIGLGVAVVAEHYWQARQALATVEVEWDYPALAGVSSEDFERQLAQALDSEEGDEAEREGEGRQALVGAERIHRARYFAPFLAHATMEPMNCVVHLQGDRAEVWIPTQAPDLAQALVHEHSGIARDRIRVHTPFLGGGFGRRAHHDFVTEATLIARAAGVPIQLVWSREDDMRHDYYRPAAMVDFSAGVDGAGDLHCWSVKRAGPNIMPYMIDEALGGLLPRVIPQSLVNWASRRGYGLFDGWVVDPTSVEGLSDSYAAPHREVRHVTVDPGLRCGFWRSVGHSFSGFFTESFMDELAYLTDRDPLEFRLQHLRHNPRLRHALQVAAARAGWGEPGEGRFLGLAAVTSFETHVAEVAEVSVTDGEIRVHKVTCVVDCGQVVNPDMVRTQMEGGIIFGLTAALKGEIRFTDGAVQQGNFDDYPLLSLGESPSIDVHLIDSRESPTGVGEPGLPPIAPAVANAVFAATGQRLRRLPLRLGGI